MAKIVKSNREVSNVDDEIKKLEKTNIKGKKKKVEEPKQKKQTKSTKKKETAKKESYFKGVKKEVSKIKWPTKNEMIKYSVATVSFIIFFALFFYIIQLLLVLLKKGV